MRPPGKEPMRHLLTSFALHHYGRLVTYQMHLQIGGNEMAHLSSYHIKWYFQEDVSGGTTLKTIKRTVRLLETLEYCLLYDF